jgi:hypothetical protein
MRIPVTFLMLATFLSGCLCVNGAHDVPLLEKGAPSAIAVPVPQFEEKLALCLEKKIILSGALGRGNFALAVCPANPQSGMRAVSLYASHDNPSDLRTLHSLQSLWKCRHLAPIQVTGTLHQIDASKPQSQYSEAEAYFVQMWGKDAKIFWLEIADASRLENLR